MTGAAPGDYQPGGVHVGERALYLIARPIMKSAQAATTQKRRRSEELIVKASSWSGKQSEERDEPQRRNTQQNTHKGQLVREP